MNQATKKTKILKSILIGIPLVIVLACSAGVDSSDSGDKGRDRSNVSEKGQKGEKSKDDLTSGQENALEKAELYLDTMPFSQIGLVKQLKFDGYSQADAEFAASHIGADWKEQAALKAEQYLDTMPFSEDGLVEQLKFDGFTDQQAVYGAGQAL